MIAISAHSPTFPSLHLRHSSFSNPSVTLATWQLIFQPFRYFTYVTAHSPTHLLLLLRHRLFTYVTWRAAHDINTQRHKYSTCIGGRMWRRKALNEMDCDVRGLRRAKHAWKQDFRRRNVKKSCVSVKIREICGSCQIHVEMQTMWKNIGVAS